jgi:hypothetical protein
VNNKTKSLHRIGPAAPPVDLIEETPQSKGAVRYTAAADQFLRQASGCNSRELGHRFLAQALAVLRPPKSFEERLRQVTEAAAFLDSFGPFADAIEGALAAQLFALHSAAMQCLQHAMQVTSSEFVDQHLNRMTKLQRAFLAAQEALHRHRGRGRQVVRVEHVHINAGAQAIVGSVDARGQGEE